MLLYSQVKSALAGIGGTVSRQCGKKVVFTAGETGDDHRRTVCDIAAAAASLYQWWDITSYQHGDSTIQVISIESVASIHSRSRLRYQVATLAAQHSFRRSRAKTVAKRADGSELRITSQNSMHLK